MSSKSPLVALAGSPNCGKTALFNAITGSRQKVANYPGVTVERKTGSAHTPAGLRISLLDLPGAYSLNAHSLDEQVTHDILKQGDPIEGQVDALVAVADATNLERNLGLVLELKRLGRPVILALNMMDLAEQRGLKLDLAVLEEKLGIPVIPTIATRSFGVDKLLKEVDQQLKAQATQPADTARSDNPRDRFQQIDEILKAATIAKSRPASWTRRIDQVVLHPVAGAMILITLLGILFQAVFTLASYPADLISEGIDALGVFVATALPAGVLQDFIVEGIIAGVGGVLVFLPQILLLFFFILLLEDSGYMSRAAFLMDRLMSKVGLHGRAFIPLLSSYACAIPGIMAARTIAQPKDRLVTILIAPLTTCSARLPVYTLLIAAFIPNTQLVWGVGLQGVVMLGLYLLGVIAAVTVAYIIKKIFLRSETTALILELPTYKWPSWRNLMFGLYERARVFVRRAGTVILSLMILLWFLASYPKLRKTLSIRISIIVTLARLVGPLSRHWLRWVLIGESVWG